MLLPISSSPVLHHVDSEIFTLRYFARCMGCSFCHDSCCQYGCDVNIGERDAILKAADALAPYISYPPSRWFGSTVHEDAEYPTGKYVRANSIDGACVFLNRSSRGCGIHRYALENKVDYHHIKPMVCWLFPVCWDKGVMRPNTDVKDDLACFGNGPTLFEASRDEIAHVFGKALVDELDALAQQIRSGHLALSPNAQAALFSDNV
jgi:Fe-S-cluster containining protein